MENLQVYLANKEELEDILDIRKKVFTEEQGIDEKSDKDGLDNMADHLVAKYDNTYVGCTRIRFLDGKAKLERLAVLKEYRKLGIGKEIMNSTIDYCKLKNVGEIYFDAQYYLKNYYEKFGFKAKGEPFEEVGIKHIQMYMDLK
ncbi:MAG: GNAT family N-acetyltransferase [Candidatus Pacearchaeota archaeon]|jgi:cystathionine beta-lyase